MMKFLKNVFNAIWRDYLLLFFMGVMVVLIILQPVSVSQLPDFIHFPTIFTLVILLVITTGVKESGLLQGGASLALNYIDTTRRLWVVLIGFAVISAMFLTNDIALFLLVPFTLQLNERHQRSLNIKPLLILETIGVNIGSMLTPIGNPQNIYLWQKSGVSFAQFVHVMLTPFIISCVLLFVLTVLLTEKSPIIHHSRATSSAVDERLAIFSVAMLIGFLLIKHENIIGYVTAGVAILYVLGFPEVIRAADWNLMLLFAVLFVDVGLLSRMSIIRQLITSLDTSNPAQIFSLGAIYSQCISNVPATLLLSHYTHQWKYLAWGANIGGNGLIVASFANLITLRLAPQQKIGWKYHAYAVPFLLISSMGVYFWLYLT